MLNTLKNYSKLLIKCNILIDNKEEFKGNDFSLKLNQKMPEHNEFEIICRADSLEDKNELPLKRTREFIGKSIQITFKQFDKETFSFFGIITSITNDKYNNYEGNIIIKGFSDTILLESGKNCRSFSSLNFQNITEKILQEYQGLNFEIKPKLIDILPFTVQYKESDYEFLRRMSERYGEWFYYDGKSIIIGTNQGKEIELIEDKDIERFEFRMRSKSQNFQYKAFNSKTGEKEEVKSEEVTYGQVHNPYVVSALKASENIFTKASKKLYNQSLLESGRLELRNVSKRQKQSGANLFEAFIVSKNPNIKLGDIVKLKAYMPFNELLKTSEVPLESYKVVEIKHLFDNNKYYNEIIAVPKDQEIPSYYNEEAISYCEEQTAIVTNNEDPEGLGRIKVRFHWQEEPEETPFIRMLQPYSGSEKGYYFIPEIGEEVMVNFEANHAEKPYVTGTLYNGKQKSGVDNSGNNLKVIKTRSGHSIILDDTEEKESITVIDKNKNTIYFDTVKKSIDISAGETISIKAKNLKIDIEENIETNAGNNIITKASKEISQDSGTKTIIYSADNMEISSNRELDIYGKSKIIGYSDGKTEFGARNQMHIYGGNSLITAKDKIEYKSPNMDKLPQSGDFKYTKEKEILSVKWMDAEMKEQVEYFRIGDKLNLLINTRNYKEGETITIELTEKGGKEIIDGIRELYLTGTIQADGTAILKECVEKRMCRNRRLY